MGPSPEEMGLSKKDMASKPDKQDAGQEQKEYTEKRTGHCYSYGLYGGRIEGDATLGTTEKDFGKLKKIVRVEGQYNQTDNELDTNNLTFEISNSSFANLLNQEKADLEKFLGIFGISSKNIENEQVIIPVDKFNEQLANGKLEMVPGNNGLEITAPEIESARETRENETVKDMIFFGPHLSFTDVEMSLDDKGHVQKVSRQKSITQTNEHYIEGLIAGSKESLTLWDDEEIEETNKLLKIFGENLNDFLSEGHDGVIEYSIDINVLNKAIEDGKIQIKKDEEGDFTFEIPESENKEE